MKAGINVELTNIALPVIDGSEFELDKLRGMKVLVAFHRFATCPFCNLRIHELIKNYEKYGENLAVAAIFDSPLSHLQKHAEKHQAPFFILADEQNKYYRQLNVERSVLKTMYGFFRRLPDLLHALMVKRYWPFPIKGNMFTMPLEILLDEDGVIQFIHRGKDEGDHLPMKQIIEFSNTGKVP